MLQDYVPGHDIRHSLHQMHGYLQRLRVCFRRKKIMRLENLSFLLLLSAACGVNPPTPPNITIICVQEAPTPRNTYFTAAPLDDTSYIISVWYVPNYCETPYPVFVSGESTPTIPYQFHWMHNDLEHPPLEVRLVPKQPIRQDNRNLYAFGIRWWWSGETK